MTDRLATLARRRARVLRIERRADQDRMLGDDSHATHVRFERAFRLRHRIESQSKFCIAMRRA